MLKTNPIDYRRIASVYIIRIAVLGILFSLIVFFVSLLRNENSLLWNPMPIINDNINPSLIHLGWDRRKLCPLVSPLLIGWLNISAVVPHPLPEDPQFEPKMKEAGLKMGGKYEPKSCKSRHKVAILVPFRNREEHLARFLRYMHPFLQRQQLNYAIFVIEQIDGLPFNRGMLLNIGVKEALSTDSFQCFVFHDVDHLPEDDRNLYSCPQDGKPRQLAFARNDGNYNIIARNFFGGVSSVSTNDFLRINGYSNLFWGWGGEDDDLYRRIRMNNLTISRITDDQPTLTKSVRYTLLSHRQAAANPGRFEILKKDEVFNQTQSDGVNNVVYKIFDLKAMLLCTHIKVDIKNSTSS